MCQHHKLVYGSLFVFVVATHVGCAGSGLKNMFTRNETDGYHSLDELEAEEQSVAAAEAKVSGDEVEKLSMATRLASWRPFSRTVPPEEETWAANGADTSAADSEDSGTRQRFPGRAFAKRESVEPDPFLTAEPKLADGRVSRSFNAVPHEKIAKIDERATPKPKSVKDAITRSRQGQDQSESAEVDPDAVAFGASQKSNSSGSNSDEEDDVFAKRLEQDFLLNSIGTLKKPETEAAAVGNDLRQKVSTRAESKKREISSLADRRIDQADFLLAADPEPFQGSKRNASTAAKSGNSLAAFDQLMGTEGSVASRDETEVTNTPARSPKKRDSSLDICAADAEALFGAAAARQNTHLPPSESAHRRESSARHADRSSAWSQASENLEGFEGEDSRQEKTGSQSDLDRGDVASVFARHLSGNSGNGEVRIHNAAFGAPSASAGNVEGDDYSAEETPDSRLSNPSALSNEHRVVTANYGTARPNVVRQSVATETSTSGDAQFTAAPVAPVSRQESVSEVASTATRPGLVQSFSTRNWMLLIGGVIVIALLFAPGRTKPLTMNSRPANG